MSPQDALNHYQILTSLLAPALLMAATGSLLVSANNRLARVVDRLRSLIAQWREKQMHVIRHHDGRMEPNPLPVLV